MRIFILETKAQYMP